MEVKDLSNAALYYNGRIVPKSSTVSSVFSDASEGTVLLVRKRESLGAKKPKAANELKTKPKEDPRLAAHVTDKHLVYGRTREGEDSLLPGYVSRPNPSPKSRLLGPSSKASPVSTLLCSTSDGKKAQGPKRRLRFESPDVDCTVPAFAAAGQEAAGHQAASITALDEPDNHNNTNQLQKEAPIRSKEAPARAQKKPHKKSSTAQVSTDAWGCNLFSARQSKASEEAMLLMPLPKCLHVPVKLFGVLSAVVLWLRFRSIQASWVTVRESLRQLQGPDAEVSSSHILQLSRLCPLLLHIGSKQSLHTTWAGEAPTGGASTPTPSVPDAAAVVADAALQASRHPDDVNLSATPDEAAVGRTAGHTEDSQTLSQQGAAAGITPPAADLGAGDGLQGTRLQSRDAGAAPGGGGFLGGEEASRAAHAGWVCNSSAPSTGTTEATTPTQSSALQAAGGASTSGTLQCSGGGTDGLLQGVHEASHVGGDFDIHLEDAPRHVASATKSSCTQVKGAVSTKPNPVVEGKRKTQRAVKPSKDVPATTAAERDRSGRHEDDISDEDAHDAQDAQAAHAQGLPAFASRSRGRRHEATFRRTLVQALALLQEACVPENSSDIDLFEHDIDLVLLAEGSRKKLMRDVVERCYPSSLILKPTAEVARATAAHPSSATGQPKEPSPCPAPTPHPGLAFVCEPPAQQTASCATQNAPPSQENQATAATAQGSVQSASAPGQDSSQGGTVEQHSNLFSTCLNSSRWHDTFSWSSVTLQRVCEASDVLMAHWKSALEGDQQAAGICNLYLHRDRPPCLDTTPLTPPQLLEHLQQGASYDGQVVHVERMPARPAKYSSLPQPLHPRVWVALGALGIREGGLFAHQVEAISTLLRGENVTVCTSTASGKSLCYLVPIIQALAEDPEACALLMFPTKALAQDQRSAIQRLLAAAFPEGPPAVEVYDGDTPHAHRADIRTRARILVTNPDMLHVSILPAHASFERFLANLRYAVVDESHMYRGAFGCHTAAVLRRLQRICSRQHACMPLFALTSATSADPAAHACALLGVKQMHVVTQDASPHGPRLFVLWNPPLVVGPRAAGAQSGSKVATGAAARAADAGAKKHDPGGKLRAVEKKRAKQEAARSAVRSKNNTKPGGVQDVGTVPPDNAWRQLAAISRKRGRAGGCAAAQLSHAPAPVETVRPDSASGRASEAGEEAHRGPGSSSLPGAVVQGTDTKDCTEPCRKDTTEAAACDDGLDMPVAADTAGDVLVVGATPGTTPRAAKMECAVQNATCAATQQLQNAADVLDVQRAPRRKRVARMKEVEELLASVGEGGSSSHRAAPPLVLGPKPAAGTVSIDEAALQSIREDLDAASAAAKKEFKTGGGRYGAAGVRLAEKRRSPILEISLLLAECIQHGLRTIAFCKTRKVCELVTSYTREVLKETAPTLVSRIAVYRSGYSAAERRAIESALHTGVLCGVAATNALELGIDIGKLDVTLHLSFPGSVASMWQQAGRAGRREQTSLSIYVAFDGPLDQHFMRKPSKLFGATVETPQVDASNLILLQQHVVCAAVELPLVPYLDQQFFGQVLHDACRALLANQKLAPAPGEPHALCYIGGCPKPSSEVSLRTIDPDRFAIINTTTGETLEEIEASNAFFEVYDGAVYMHHGRSFLCTKLDLSARVAHVTPSAVKYFTSPVNHKQVHVVGGHVAYDAGAQKAFEATSARVGQALVTVRTSAFVRTARSSHITFDRVDLFLPDVQYMTEAAYIRVPQAARKACEAAGAPYRDSLHAAGHALLNVMPLYVICNPSDIRTECENPYAVRYRPERLLLYDTHPGGLGLSAKAGPRFTKLMQEALKVVTECDCTEVTGCPACVQFARCDAYNTVLNKQGAIVVLAKTLEYELGGLSSDSNAASLVDTA